MDLQEYISSGTLELYVAGALPPEEMEEVRKAASSNPLIAAEIRKIEEVMEEYIMAQAIEPRAELKDRVINAISKDNNAEIKQQAPVHKEAVVRSIKPSNNKAGFWLAAAVITMLIVSNVFFLQRWRTAETQLSSMIAQNYKMNESYTLVKNNYMKMSGDLAVATNPKCKVVQMKGLPIAPESLAMVYWNEETKEAFVDVKNLPVPPSDKQYQLWALVDGKPVDAGVFEVNPDSTGMQKVKRVENAQAFAVTLEKKGGSESPTMDQMYVMAKI